MYLNFLSDRFPEFDDSSGSEFIPDSDVSSDTLSVESVTSEVIPVPKHLTRQGKDKQKGERTNRRVKVVQMLAKKTVITLYHPHEQPVAIQ